MTIAGRRAAPFRLVAPLCLFIFWVPGCDKPSRSNDEKTLERGEETTEQRKVPVFDALVVPGRTRVRVEPGEPGAASLKGPRNYLERIELRTEAREVDGKTVEVLVVDLPLGVKPPLPEVELVTPELRFVETRGPAQVSVGNFNSSLRSITAAGFSTVELDPATYRTLKLKASKAARIRAQEVTVETAEAHAEEMAGIYLGQVASMTKTEYGHARVTYDEMPGLK